MVSFCYVNPCQAVTPLVAVFVSLQLTANYDYYLYQNMHQCRRALKWFKDHILANFRPYFAIENTVNLARETIGYFIYTLSSNRKSEELAILF